MIYSSRKSRSPKEPEKMPEVLRGAGIIIIDVGQNTGLTDEEHEHIRRVFEQIREDLDNMISTNQDD